MVPLRLRTRGYCLRKWEKDVAETVVADSVAEQAAEPVEPADEPAA